MHLYGRQSSHFSGTARGQDGEAIEKGERLPHRFEDKGKVSGVFCEQGSRLVSRMIVFCLCPFPYFTLQDGQATGADPVAHLFLGAFLKGLTDGSLAA